MSYFIIVESLRHPFYIIFCGFVQDCKCEGSCNDCSVTFELSVKNTSDVDIDVTSHDLISAMNSDVKPVDHADTPEKVLIVRLGPGQELSLTAVARKVPMGIVATRI